MVSTTHEQLDSSAKKKKAPVSKGAGGTSKQHDDFIEQLYSTHRLYSQMQQNLIP